MTEHFFTDAEKLILSNQMVIMSALTALLNGDGAQGAEELQELLGTAFHATDMMLSMDESVWGDVPQ